MKINENVTALTLQKKATSGKADNSGEATFSKLLDSKLLPPQVAAIPEPSAVAPVLETTPVSLEVRIGGLAIAEDTMSVLDAYSGALSNLAYPSKELEPYISDLEERISALHDIKNQFPSDDPLVSLLDKVGAVTVVQIAKYRRGDFGV